MAKIGKGRAGDDVSTAGHPIDLDNMEVDNDGQIIIRTGVYRWSDGSFHDDPETSIGDIEPDPFAEIDSETFLCRQCGVVNCPEHEEKATQEMLVAEPYGAEDILEDVSMDCGLTNSALDPLAGEDNETIHLTELHDE